MGGFFLSPAFLVSGPIGLIVAVVCFFFLQVSLGFAALYGLQAFGTVMAFQTSVKVGLLGLASSLALDWLFAGSSQVAKEYKYVAKIGDSLKRVKEVVPGAKMLVDVGGSLVPLKRLIGL